MPQVTPAAKSERWKREGTSGARREQTGSQRGPKGLGNLAQAFSLGWFHF